MKTPQYAGFWRRFGASLIDSIILLILLTILSRILFGPEYLDWMMREPSGYYDIYSPLSELLNNLLPLVLTVYLWTRYMGTPGKLLLSCHVVDADTLKPIGFGKALLRYVAYLLSVLPLLLGFFWVIWDKRKQGFHDKIANTVVILVDDADKTIEELEQEAL